MYNHSIQSEMALASGAGEPMSPEESAKVVEQVLGNCGNGSILHIGAADVGFLQRFLELGVQVFSVGTDAQLAAACAQRLPQRFLHWNGQELPFGEDHFSTVLITGLPAGFDCAEIAREVLRVVRHNVFIYMGPQDPSQAQAFRHQLEARFFRAGFRKHPAYYRVNDYQALQSEYGHVSIVLEKVPGEAAAVYPLAALEEERDLHMDMTREPGSRSDAHIIRYVLASRYIRPGDRVLDAACGLGYGSNILLKCSEAHSVLGVDGSSYAVKYAQLNFAEATTGLMFREGWLPEAIADLPDDSIDLITSFETLEHVQEPQALLAEFHRVLKPSGRIVLSVPNDWSDETGEDPNPFHFHVYTWAKVFEETRQHFLVEAAYAQTADQFKKNKQWAVGTRKLHQTPVESLVDDDPECEWCLLVGMKDPLSGISVPYEETTYDQYPENPDWHVTCFDEYANPWLVKGIVTIGHRLTNPLLLQAVCERVVAQAPAGSPDLGAGLCISGYRLLESGVAEWAKIESFEASCFDYLEGLDASGQRFRWQVSLTFILGQLWQKWGSNERAVPYYEKCIEFDCARYSTSLVTKQLQSCLHLGLIASGREDFTLASDYWRSGLSLAQRALATDWRSACGSLDNPADFGIPELGAIVEYASSCAFALHYLQNAKMRPAQWWHQWQRDRISQLRRLESMRREIDFLNILLSQKDMIAASSKDTEEARRSLQLLEDSAKEIGRLNQIVLEKDLRLQAVGADLEGARLALENFSIKSHQLLESSAKEVSRLNQMVLEKDSRLQAVGAELEDVRRVPGEGAVKSYQLLEDSAKEISRLNQILLEKDSRLRAVGAELEQTKRAPEGFSVESYQLLEDSAKEVGRLNQILLEKDSKLQAVGTELEEARHALGGLSAESYQLLEDSAKEVQRLNQILLEKDSRLQAVGAELEEARRAPDSFALHGYQLLEDSAKEVGRLNQILLEKDSRLQAVGAELEQARRALESYSVESTDKCDATVALAAAATQPGVDRVARLRSAAAIRPMTLRAMARVLWYTGGLLTPTPLRAKLGNALLPLALRLRSGVPQAAVGQEERKGGGYQVKQPQQVVSNRPVVGHIIANFMTGGSSRLVVDIYEYLGGHYDQRVITSLAPQPAAYEGIPISEIRFPADETPFVEYFQELKPDFLHMHYWGDCDEPWYAKAVRAAEVLGIPVIQNINTPVSPYVSQSIARYVYVSDYVRDVFGKNEEHHLTVYPGSDFSMFEASGKPDSGEDCIGMVYRLEHDKLNAESILPFILAAQKIPSIKVLIVGGGSLLEPFRMAARAANVEQNFEFTGYVPYETLPSLYERMKVFVAPVWKESFGQVSPFAMNMRVPVVGYDIGAIGEIVDDSSLLAPPGDAERLSDIIVSLLKDTERRQAVANHHRQRAQEHFSIQAMIEHYREIYRSLMVEKKK